MTVSAFAVWIFADALLVVSVVLIAQLRSYDLDRDFGRTTVATRVGVTAARVIYSILVVVAFALLPVAWALALIPTGSLAAFLAAPLAMRLGDTVSHRSGVALDRALREGALLVVLFGLLFSAGLVWP